MVQQTFSHGGGTPGSTQEQQSSKSGKKKPNLNSKQRKVEKNKKLLLAKKMQVPETPGKDTEMKKATPVAPTLNDQLDKLMTPGKA